MSGKKTADSGNLLLIALVGLALVASVVMLFTSNVNAMKIATLAALWAAAIGAFLVNHYRRRSEADRSLLEEERRTHRAELENEYAAHREQELRIEQDFKDRQLEPDPQLAEIKAQLAILREQLEDLTGRDLSYEPAALRAEARRIQEIESSKPDTFTPVSESIDTSADASSFVTSFESPSYASAQSYASEPYSSSKAYGVSEPSYSADSHTSSGSSASEPYTSAFSWDSSFSEKEADPERGAHEVPEVEEPSPEPAEHKGRRRRDDHAGSLTVADLLKRK